MLKLLLVLAATWVLASGQSGCRRGASRKTMMCKDMHLREGDIMKLEEKETSDEDMREMHMLRVTGDIDERTCKNFPDVKEMTMDRCDIRKFKPDLRLKELDVWNCKWPKVTEDFLTKYRDLTTVTMISEDGIDMEPRAFKTITKIIRLNITPRIDHLKKEFLEGLDKLEKLKIGKKITKIDEDAFWHMKELRTLVLDDNEITDLELNTFKEMKKLERLSMLGCHRLERLDMNMFAEQRDMRQIGLPAKVVKTLTAEELKHRFPKLREVRFEFENRDCRDVISMMNKLKEMKICILFDVNDNRRKTC